MTVLVGSPLLVIAAAFKVVGDWFFVIKATREGKSI
jgi:hypothetical protein